MPAVVIRATFSLLTADHALVGLRLDKSNIVRVSSSLRGRLSIHP